MESPAKMIFCGLLLGVLLSPGWAGAQPVSLEPAVPPEQQQRLELMKTRGTEASLTILPVRLGGEPFDRVTEVIGLFLEEQGLTTIELGKTVFGQETRTELQGLAAAVGEFVKDHPVTTDYVLYAEINGSRETGIDELRAVVTDRAGAVVWTDCQTPQDEAFKSLESPEPMSLCVLLVERLSPYLSLDEETARAAKPGKLAAIMAERSGMPPENETAPLPERLKLMKESRQQATLMIFPVRVGGEADTASAAGLEKMINDAALCRAIPAKVSVLLKASQADPNEQKILWDLAREVREYARKNPADADYVLFADYVFNPRQWEQGFVHFVVCDREGEWVIVDMQNSHHPDYRSIKPVSKEDCSKLLVKRLGAYLIESQDGP
jgi:hypothetical protein